jgi:hypothetical protein
MEINYQQVANIDKTINQSLIVKLPDQLWIPNDPENTDWQAYQLWIAAGNTPLPPA